jgi:hypothetical protein
MAILSTIHGFCFATEGGEAMGAEMDVQMDAY